MKTIKEFEKTLENIDKILRIKCGRYLPFGIWVNTVHDIEKVTRLIKE